MVLSFCGESVGWECANVGQSLSSLQGRRNHVSGAPNAPAALLSFSSGVPPLSGEADEKSAEAAMKPFRYCRHVKQDGIPCGSPALRGESYCYYHVRYKGYPLRTWPNRRRLAGLHFPRGMALNLTAAETNLERIDRLLASGTSSDPESAGMIRYGLQMKIHDLRYMQARGEIGSRSRLKPLPRSSKSK
jgi:hypothetical protein